MEKPNIELYVIKMNGLYWNDDINNTTPDIKQATKYENSAVWKKRKKLQKKYGGTMFIVRYS